MTEIDATAGRHLAGKYAIVGVGETTYTRGGGRSTRAMATTAIANAMADAGLTADGVAEWMKMLGDMIRQRQAEGIVNASIDPEAFVIQVIHLMSSGAAGHSTLGTLLGEEREGMRRYREQLLRTVQAALRP